MKTFYLLRHAHAEEYAPEGGDRMRPLSPQGIDAARAVGRYMKAKNMSPAVILHSPALRTTQTAMLVTAEIAASPAPDDRLYQASTDDLLAIMQETDDTADSLLIVSHNPATAELAYRMGKVMQYAPATLSVFTADVTRWADVTPHTATRADLFTPD